MDEPLPQNTPGSNNTTPDGYATDFGNSPEVNKSTLEPTNRVVESVDQALSVCQTLEWDANLIIRNAAKITALKQGEKPYDTKRLQRQGKAWKTNVSTGGYSTTLARVAPRLYMPLKQASTLTAAQLPQGWPDGEKKSKFFRETITDAIRSWPRWNWFLTGLAKEVTDYGFVFAAFTDPLEWRPHLVRMDRGFVPRGTEIMDLNPAFFELKWDYKPDELLSVARNAVTYGSEDWEKDNVAVACQWAYLPPAANVPPTEWRKWEELVREQVWNTTYKKGYRIIETKHLFVLEASGLVSHYIIWPDGDEGEQLLYSREDAYPSMADVVIPMVFGWGDGTIHGSWGAGHLLFDLGKQLEKIRCDMIDNLRNANKQRLQVNDPKDINDVKMVVNDTDIIISGAQFANNVGGAQQNVDAYIKLNEFLSNFMDTKVGAYIPPIPVQSQSDVTATQVNAAIAQQQEASTDAVDTFLSQAAHVISAMTKRLTNPLNTDPVSQWVQRLFSKSLTPEEIELLVNQPQVRSVVDFTPISSQAKAQFARSVLGNPLYLQTKLARLIAEGVPGGGGSRLADEVVVPEGDTQQQTEAQRQQILENSAMAMGQDVPVLATDNHWIHMQTMKQPLVQAIQAGMLAQSASGLKHYAAHYTAGVATKSLPEPAINSEKSFIAQAQKALDEIQQLQSNPEAAAGGQQLMPGSQFIQ